MAAGAYRQYEIYAKSGPVNGLGHGAFVPIFNLLLPDDGPSVDAEFFMDHQN